MRSSISLKLAVLAPVIYATWFATSNIMMAQQFKPRPVEQPSISVRSTVIDGPPKNTARAADRPVTLLSKFSLKSFDVSVQGDQVQITSSVSMNAIYRDTVCLWRLRTFQDGVNEPVADVAYDQQLFEMHPSGSMSPTFSEAFKLPPGKYRILLTLYELPKGYDIAQLNDETKFSNAAILKGSKKIVVN